tara:strand:- start:182 stop:376 length:195 start_codon:yes stop_codon:yes gene_type:complete
MLDGDIIRSLEGILNSDAKNYLESYERLLLMNALEKSKIKDLKLTEHELHSLIKIIKKYNKFLN